MPDGDAPTMNLISVPVGSIKPGSNDRKVFDPGKLAELAASIDRCGLLEPPVVRPVAGGGYELVAGERRFRAVSEILGWDTIAVHVRVLNDEAAAESMLAENFHRVDLNPIEEADAYQKWADQFGWTADEIAARANTTVHRVKSRLRLAALTDEWKYLVAHGGVKISYVTGLGSLDENRQRQAYRYFRDDPNITREAFSAIVARLWEYQSAETLFEMTTEEWSAAPPVAEPKPVSRTALIALIERLAGSTSDEIVAAEAARVLAAEKAAVAARRSQAGVKAASTRARLAA